MLTSSLLAALPKPTRVFSPKEEMSPLPLQTMAQAQSQAAGPATSVQVLVALAAAEPTIERRRRIAADAERGLKSLEGLHAELLTGTPKVERLAEIAKWSESFAASEDPVIAALLAEIDLRVKVELAKYDVQA